MNIEVNDDDLNIDNLQESPINMDQHNKQSKMNKNIVIIVLQYTTTIIHILSLLFVVLIITLCILQPFEFFTWHPFLLSIGWGLLVTQGILSVSPHNYLTTHLTRNQRHRLHWSLQLTALILILIGFAIVYINKNYLNKYHFQSWHGLFGLITIVCLIPTVFGGILVLNNQKFKQYIKPRLSKLLHISGGMVCLIFGGLSFILSVYSKWFQRQTNDDTFIFTYSLLATLSIISVILYNPIRNCYYYMK